MNTAVLWLAWRSVRARPLVGALLTLCVCVACALPLAASALLERFDTALRARASDTRIVVGPEVSRFDLVFAALYFRDSDIEPLPARTLQDAERPGLTVIPVYLASCARGRPLVGVDDRYYAHRGLRARTGELPFLLGEAALGATAARDLDLAIDDTLVTDPPEGLDLASPTPIELTITSILAPTGTPDDEAIFTTLPSAWLAAGRLHGHADPEAYDDPTTVIGRTGDHTALSGAVRTHQRIDDDTRADFHFHGDPDTLPLTALILAPATDKDETIALARLDALPGVRALRAPDVVNELLATVLRIKAAFDVIALLFAATTTALLVLVFWLSAQLRADETRTIRDIGAARWTPALLFASEGAIILVLGASAGLALAWGVVAVAERTLIWL